MPKRLALALLICCAAASPGRADEISNRLLVAFRSVCLVKPDSIWAIDALAKRQGFVRGFDPAKVIPQNPPVDEFNLILDWRLGEGEDQIALNGLALGNDPLKYLLLCQMAMASDLLPDDIIAGLRAIPGLGAPQLRKDKDGKHMTAVWQIPADPRHDVLEVRYDPGKERQRVYLSFQQDIAPPTPK